MDAVEVFHLVPGSEATNLCLVRPTQEELSRIYRVTFTEWGDALTLAEFLEESEFLTQVPLAKEGRMASWILTENDKPENERRCFCSCETFSKRTFVVDKDGNLSENIVHGIASVFVNPQYRNKGFGRRLMRELAQLLPKRRMIQLHSIGSVLYSDIGTLYYTKLGWPAPSVNFHLEFDATTKHLESDARSIQEIALPKLCQEDEIMIQKSMVAQPRGKTYFMIVPDSDHMLWHISKESFACEKIFGDSPQAKVATSGVHGNRIWAIWAHLYYCYPDSRENNNVLYTLRLLSKVWIQI